MEKLYWRTTTRPRKNYYHDYMQRPKQPYPRAPKTGSVDMELQEPSLYEQEYGGMENENKPFSPSTTEKEPSAASKRKTITLNERARPSISTMEKSPSTTQSMVDARHRQQMQAALEFLRMMEKKFAEERGNYDS